MKNSISLCPLRIAKKMHFHTFICIANESPGMDLNHGLHEQCRAMMVWEYAVIEETSLGMEANGKRNSP